MRSALLSFFCFALGAQTSTTTVSGTITDAAGDLLSGSCAIHAVGPFSAATGWRVIGATVTVKFTNGQFLANVIPTDSATPAGQYYKVTCSIPDQTVNGHIITKFSWGPRYWLVPTNAGSIDLGTVEITAPPPTPSWSLLLSQVGQSRATQGQVQMWMGSSWQPGTLPPGLLFTSPPQGGQYIRWNATQNAWQPVSFSDQEILSGTVDGTNATFTLLNPPNPPAGLVLFRNGLAQLAGADYTISCNTVTFVPAVIPQPGDLLIAWCRY